MARTKSAIIPVKPDLVRCGGPVEPTFDELLYANSDLVNGTFQCMMVSLQRDMANEDAAVRAQARVFLLDRVLGKETALIPSVADPPQQKIGGRMVSELMMRRTVSD